MNTRLYNARILTMADGFEPIWGEIWIQDDKIIYVGEESGALDSILTKSANFYKEEADEAITRLVGLIEPVMIIFMGTAIGFVIAGILPALYGSFENIQ